MRVVVCALGTRGDVQPPAVLAAELQARGHQVLVATTHDLIDFVASLGLRTAPLSADIKGIFQSPEGQRLMASGNARAFLKHIAGIRRERVTTVQDEMIALARGADLLIAGKHSEDDTACIAEAYGVPLVTLHHAPWGGNPVYPAFLATTRRLPGGLRQASHWYVERATWKSLEADIRRIRQVLALPPVSKPTEAGLYRVDALQIQAYSRHLTPELVDWHPRRPLTGFIEPTRAQHEAFGDATADPDLGRWLDAGDPPIYFGFGSMPVLDPDAMLQMVTNVSRALNMRGLVVAGWTELRRTPAPDGPIHVTPAVDHGAVLPRCRVAVHHGGAGTTAASIGAGLPTVAAAVFMDQPFWANRLERLGVGRAMRFADLTEKSLLRAIESLLGPEPKRRAAAIASAMRTENGTSNAADAVEKAPFEA
ncbi:glycosyltransferase [Sphaerisporangium sp. TRM90804]|uniref:glycosyltransferase n=1 Tax=Sphaerisporangium sp. TRM90804 TaxID=3031113 RepID=UPI00244A8DE7|nr:glycosyltransferase [Sphaerisporangium sp. TRM90804]MDH2425399.1 glycosyltransferase [Sphaerisporangium sp. TRM90804]